MLSLLLQPWNYLYGGDTELLYMWTVQVILADILQWIIIPDSELTVKLYGSRKSKEHRCNCEVCWMNHQKRGLVCREMSWNYWIQWLHAGHLLCSCSHIKAIFFLLQTSLWTHGSIVLFSSAGPLLDCSSSLGRYKHTHNFVSTSS